MTAEDFEHKTQAATGQTTGSWCVLFTSRDQRVVNVLWERLAAAQLETNPGLLFGQVLIEDSRQLAQRFGLTQGDIPAARLFRQQKMHVFSGHNGPTPTLRPELERFCTSTDLPAVEVPQEESAWSKPWDQLVHDTLKSFDELPVHLRAGSFALVVVAFIALYVVIRGVFIRLPYERPGVIAKKES